MKRAALIILLIILLPAATIFAETPEITRGIDYLSSVQSSDGSWSDAALSTDGLPATVSVIETLQALSLTGSPNYANAQLWLQYQNLNTTDFLAERIHALTVAGTDRDQLLSYIDQLSYACEDPRGR